MTRLQRKRNSKKDVYRLQITVLLPNLLKLSLCLLKGIKWKWDKVFNLLKNMLKASYFSFVHQNHSISHSIVKKWEIQTEGTLFFPMSYNFTFFKNKIITQRKIFFVRARKMPLAHQCSTAIKSRPENICGEITEGRMKAHVYYETLLFTLFSFFNRVGRWRSKKKKLSVLH